MEVCFLPKIGVDVICLAAGHLWLGNASVVGSSGQCELNLKRTSNLGLWYVPDQGWLEVAQGGIWPSALLKIYMWNMLQMQSNKMHWAVSVSVRFNPNKVKPPSMPNFKTLLLRYVRVQSFENTPRLTTAEFFNVALTLGAGLCFVCMACKQFKHVCSIYWLMRVWTSKETGCQSTLYDSWMAAYDGQILYDAHSSSWNMSLGECWCFVDFNPPQFLR